MVCSGRMRCNPIEHPLLCAEAPFLSKDEREKMVEHLFEGFASPAVFLAKNPVLSSFALGRQTSLVVDMGHSGTVGMASLIAVLPCMPQVPADPWKAVHLSHQTAKCVLTAAFDVLRCLQCQLCMMAMC